MPRRIFGLFAGCITVFIYLFTTVYMDYIRTVETNKYVDWDVKTITAGDYTIEFDVTKEQYEHWKKNYLMEESAITESAQFKIYIQEFLQRQCSAIPN